MTGRPLVSLGDIVNAEAGDYYRGDRGPLERGEGDLHMRVTHVLASTETYAGDWIALRGIERPPGQPEQPEACFVVHRRALPGYEPRPLPTVAGQVEWTGE
ncbi:hypothetical protein [Micromonospora sp. NPDC004704]